MNHVVIVADMEVMDLTAATGCQVCQQQRPTVSPGVAPVPGMTSQPPGGTPAALGHFLLGKASIFPYWNRYLFLHIMPLHSHPPVDLPKALSTIMVFNAALLLTKELIS